MQMIYLIRMMTVLISASHVQLSNSSPNPPDTKREHQGSTRHPRDTEYSQLSHTNHNHVHDSLSKRAFREEDGVPVELTDSDGLEDRRTLDLSLGLAASTGTAGSMQTWAGQRSLTPGGLFPVECCPSEVHLIHPRGGISRDGRLLELYRDHRTVQTFYQSTCLSQVRDRPCHFVRQSLQRFSRCVQKYSFVYAFVRDFNVSESFRLDYIRLKSGCSCEVKL